MPQTRSQSANAAGAMRGTSTHGKPGSSITAAGVWGGDHIDRVHRHVDAHELRHHDGTYRFESAYVRKYHSIVIK
jgi:hypothetical protein